jgi:hypothetical protein
LKSPINLTKEAVFFFHMQKRTVGFFNKYIFLPYVTDFKKFLGYSQIRLPIEEVARNINEDRQIRVRGCIDSSPRGL